jgi:hypothetical protein
MESYFDHQGRQGLQGTGQQPVASLPTHFGFVSCSSRLHHTLTLTW